MSTLNKLMLVQHFYQSCIVLSCEARTRKMRILGLCTVSAQEARWRAREAAWTRRAGAFDGVEGQTNQQNVHKNNLAVLSNHQPSFGDTRGHRGDLYNPGTWVHMCVVRWDERLRCAILLRIWTCFIMLMFPRIYCERRWLLMRLRSCGAMMCVHTGQIIHIMRIRLEGDNNTFDTRAHRDQHP